MTTTTTATTTSTATTSAPALPAVDSLASIVPLQKDFSASQSMSMTAGVLPLSSQNPSVNNSVSTENWAKTSNRYVLKRKKTIMITDTLRFFEDEYVKGEPLGEPGAFGITYACYARTDESKTQFAVKQINKVKFYHIERNARNDILGKMKNEIDISKTLRHPNIVELYDVFEDRNYIYLVMDYLSGGELFGRISDNGSLSERDAAHITQQILDALAYMQENNICHLDLKPDNIMFEDRSENARVKLIDFGMSQVVPRLQKVKQTVGTPYYTAPEVIDGQYDRAADIWSVGVILFCMLFGYPPFYVDTETLNMGQSEDSAIFDKIRAGFDPTVKEGWGAHFPQALEVSEEVKHLISGMLKVSVKDRMTVSECLAHPWIRGKAGDKRLPQTVFDSLQNFTGTCKFKTLIAKMFAQKLDPYRYAQTLEVFKKWDTDGDGQITLSEFKKGMMETTNLSSEEIAQIFANLDQDDSRTITIDELIFAASFNALVSVDERMYAAFSLLDKDGNGTLTMDELKKAIQETLKNDSIEDIDAIIAEIDSNEDGEIDYEEFLRALHPHYNEPEFERAPDTKRLKSRGFGSFDQTAFNAFLKQSDKADLIEYHWQPKRMLLDFKKVSSSMELNGMTAADMQASSGNLPDIAEHHEMMSDDERAIQQRLSLETVAAADARAHHSNASNTNTAKPRSSHAADDVERKESPNLNTKSNNTNTHQNSSHNKRAPKKAQSLSSISNTSPLKKGSYALTAQDDESTSPSDDDEYPSRKPRTTSDLTYYEKQPRQCIECVIL